MWKMSILVLVLISEVSVLMVLVFGLNGLTFCGLGLNCLGLDFLGLDFIGPNFIGLNFLCEWIS